MKYGNSHFSNMLRGERTAEKLVRLYSLLKSDDRLAILMYGEPDPDSLASAWALMELLKGRLGECVIISLEHIKRQQNQIFARKLKIPFQIQHEVEWGKYTKFALVDAQPDFFKPPLPISFDIIIDHHPKKGNYPFKFSDIRPRYGSTATILLEYLVTAQKPLGKKLATALCYGLNTDTDDLVRGVSPQDVAALGLLKPRTDTTLLHSLELAEIPRAYAPYFTEALKRSQTGLCPIVCFSKIPSPDVCVHIADFLSQFTSMKWVAVGGLCGPTLHVVLRESSIGADVGKIARVRLAHLGSAGGHKGKSRAAIPREVVEEALGKDPSDEALTEWLTQILRKSKAKKNLKG
jgi:nanoRNase/pAp phosphatase (c-di-AMP/oligoRNAs hydrolase)